MRTRRDPYCDPWWALSTNGTDLVCDFVELKFYWERKICKYKNKYLITIIGNALKEECKVLEHLLEGPDLE